MWYLLAQTTAVEASWPQVFNWVAMPCVLLLSLIVAVCVFFQNRNQRRIDRALSLYQSLMTSEFLTKARLISQQYLLPSQNNPHFAKLSTLNYEELDLELRKPEYEKDVRFYIRAIPNFFHTVHLARKNG
ncbi:MAG TPA: hypothetical protein PKD64_10545 [Pirellulaceae bacterium]|nr:hypothetical protein [Pirellulaceae bacterium]